MPVNLVPDEISSSGILWGASDWAWPTVGIAAALMILVFWNYGWTRIGRGVHAFAFLLKLIAIGLIAVCLLDPLRSGTRPRPQANLFPILVDTSQSMTMLSASDASSRGDRVIDLLNPEKSWRVRLAQDFDVRPYRFASRLEPLGDVSSLEMNGEASTIAGSVQSLGQRLAGRPVGGLLLFSDGNLTDESAADADWSKIGFPIYPVVSTAEKSPGDIRIDSVSVSQSDFETAPISVKVIVASQSLPEGPVVIQLEEQETKKVIQEQTIVVPRDGQSQPLVFKFRPYQPGVGFYRLVVFLDSDRDKVDAGEEGAEATFANNIRWLSIDRGHGPHRILYVSGRPNWEFKFLRRAVHSDPEVQLVGLLRIANKEAKFTFRDRDVGNTNSLFAGLGSDEEEAAQQYDEPVMIRLGVEESEELSSGFPRTSEELFGYEAVILDDIEPDFFTQDQLLMLRRFIAFRGGGLLMLGGQESFDTKRFANTPLGELCAVYPPRQSTESPQEMPGNSPELSYRVEMTREGMLQPWFRLRETEGAETQRLRDMPSFNTINRVGPAKPGAIQLATVREAHGELSPGLVVQRFGKGKSAALTLGDMWKWSMRRVPGQEDEPARQWRQMMRWLVSDVPQRVDCKIEATDDGGRRVSVVTDVVDEGFLSVDNAKVDIEITPPTGPAVKLIAQDDGLTPGRYVATYFASQPGGYLVTARVTAEDGSEVGEVTTGWAATPDESEFRQWSVNRQWLDKIAKQSGGQIVDDTQLESFVADLSNRKVPVMQVWTYPVWHQPWVMLIAIACLCGEWGLRRWKGLS